MRRYWGAEGIKNLKDLPELEYKTSSGNISATELKQLALLSDAPAHRQGWGFEFCLEYVKQRLISSSFQNMFSWVTKPITCNFK